MPPNKQSLHDACFPISPASLHDVKVSQIRLAILASITTSDMWANSRFIVLGSEVLVNPYPQWSCGFTDIGEISLKDATPLPLTSNVVYQYKCFRDENITYIGETTRPLKVRVDEHLSAKNNKSTVGSHITCCDACKNGKPDLTNFHIMKRCRTHGETRIMEALLIRRHASKLNKQMFLKGASFILNVY